MCFTQAGASKTDATTVLCELKRRIFLPQQVRALPKTTSVCTVRGPLSRLPWNAAAKALARAGSVKLMKPEPIKPGNCQADECTDLSFQQ